MDAQAVDFGGGAQVRHVGDLWGRDPTEHTTEVGPSWFFTWPILWCFANGDDPPVFSARQPSEEMTKLLVAQRPRASIAGSDPLGTWHADAAPAGSVKTLDPGDGKQDRPCSVHLHGPEILWVRSMTRKLNGLNDLCSHPQTLWEFVVFPLSDYRKQRGGEH